MEIRVHSRWSSLLFLGYHPVPPAAQLARHLLGLLP